jgi:hypothetical protein
LFVPLVVIEPLFIVVELIPEPCVPEAVAVV